MTGECIGRLGAIAERSREAVFPGHSLSVAPRVLDPDRDALWMVVEDAGERVNAGEPRDIQHVLRACGTMRNAFEGNCVK
jgi:hypothetical protein